MNKSPIKQNNQIKSTSAKRPTKPNSEPNKKVNRNSHQIPHRDISKSNSPRRNADRTSNPSRQPVKIKRPVKVIRTPMNVRIKRFARKALLRAIQFMIFYIVFAIIYCGYIFYDTHKSTSNDIKKLSAVVEVEPASESRKAVTDVYNAQDIYFNSVPYLPINALSAYFDISEIGDYSSHSFIFNGGNLVAEERDITDILASEGNAEEIRDASKIRCFFNATYIEANGEKIFLESPVILSGGETYLPISFFKDNFQGLKVEQNDAEGTFYISKEYGKDILLSISPDTTSERVSYPFEKNPQDNDEGKKNNE